MADKKRWTERIYGVLAEDEDARVCKDIPDEACNEQPKAFLAMLFALSLTKLGDALVSARLVLPWMLSATGAPAFFISLLVPLRESLSLLPQLFIAQRLREQPIRKWFWVAGSIGQALSLLAMALGLGVLSGASFAWWVVAWLCVFSLSRGVCSVTDKDVVGKTVSKSRRGRLTGIASSVSGAITLGVALVILFTPAFSEGESQMLVFYALLLGAGLLWLFAAASYAQVPETKGATEGGGNAIATALKSIKLVIEEPQFGHFVVTRAFLVASAFAIPYIVVLIQQQSDGELTSLGGMMLASGLAGMLAGNFWGRWSDRASHHVMAAAACLAAMVMTATILLYALQQYWLGLPWVGGALIFLAAVAHHGARVGRKTYLVDMANQENRAQYTAVSNTLIGILLLAGGLLGFVDQWFGTQVVLLVLISLSLVAAWQAVRLPSVSDEET